MVRKVLMKYKVPHIAGLAIIFVLGITTGHFVSDADMTAQITQLKQDSTSLEKQLKKEQKTKDQLQKDVSANEEQIAELEQAIASIEKTKNDEPTDSTIDAVSSEKEETGKENTVLDFILSKDYWVTNYAVNKDPGDTSDTPPPRYADISLTMTSEDAGELESNNLIEMGYVYHTFSIVENTGNTLILSIENPYAEREYKDVHISRTDDAINVSYDGMDYILES